MHMLTPYYVATNRKHTVKHFKVFGCPAVFKQYETYEKGKVIKNKYTQQGTCGIFVGVPDDSASWLFYVPDSKRTYISMDVEFDEQFTAPLCIPDLPYQGAIRLRNVESCKPNSDPIIEHTGDPSGENEQFLSDTDLPIPKTRHSNIDLAYLSNDQQQESCKMDTPHIHENCIKTNPQSIHNQQLVHKFFYICIKQTSR